MNASFASLFDFFTPKHMIFEQSLGAPTLSAKACDHLYANSEERIEYQFSEPVRGILYYFRDERNPLELHKVLIPWDDATPSNIALLETFTESNRLNVTRAENRRGKQVSVYLSNDLRERIEAIRTKRNAEAFKTGNAEAVIKNASLGKFIAQLAREAAEFEKERPQ